LAGSAFKGGGGITLPTQAILLGKAVCGDCDEPASFAIMTMLEDDRSGRN